MNREQKKQIKAFRDYVLGRKVPKQTNKIAVDPVIRDALIELNAKETEMVKAYEAQGMSGYVHALAQDCMADKIILDHIADNQKPKIQWKWKK